ncbi:TPA: hypothetical protein HA371_01305 [Candidatus Woesearchaeota archaeon]|nr:hypothetical protein [Candidatus Woesearchaeota archaeon]
MPVLSIIPLNYTVQYLKFSLITKTGMQECAIIVSIKNIIRIMNDNID